MLNGLWYILSTGCQWKAVHRDWFGSSSGVLHERFQTSQGQDVWDKVFQTSVKFYRRERRISGAGRPWTVDGPRHPLGGGNGRSPTNHADFGSKIPRFRRSTGGATQLSTLAAPISTTVVGQSIYVPSPSTASGYGQHLYGDKGYDY